MRHNQNRRSRGRNNNRKGPNPLTRSYESNGPDVKVRGTAMHVAEKYMSLARDAQSSGDIVAAENYLQHAEHYNRIVMAAQSQFQQTQPSQFRDGEEGADEDRGMNGRSRFDANGDVRDDDGEDRYDRFDSTEEEEERTNPRQQQRPDDRDRQRGPRPDRFERGARSDNSERGHSDRGHSDRGDRPDRGEPSDRGERQDRGDRPARAERFDRGDRPERQDRGNDRGERSERNDRGDRPERAARSERFDRGERREQYENGGRTERFTAEADAEPATEPDVPSSYPGAEEAPAAAPRRRRGRPARVEAAEAGGEAPETTPDGAAALVAFPE